MFRPIRKRVSQVGSGAWSIYLPKKWIDTWEPAQQEGREVELRAIGPGMLITPVITRQRHDAVVRNDAADVRMRLLSAYLRGHHDVHLQTEGEFGNDCIAQARDFLRHLDERLEAFCGPEEIGFHLRADLPATVGSSDDLLQILAAKVDEVMRLAEDAIRHYRHDADRTLHALRLLRDTHEEDVSRLFYQATRMVATLEIPMPSVSAYQLLGLAAADLQRVSEQCLRIADAILLDYGITQEQLDFPRSHLLDLVTKPAVTTGVSRSFLHIARQHFDPIRGLLAKVIAGLRDADQAILGECIAEAEQHTLSLRRAVFEAAGASWGQEGVEEEAMMALNTSKFTTCLVQALDHLRNIAVTARSLTAVDAS